MSPFGDSGRDRAVGAIVIFVSLVCFGGARKGGGGLEVFAQLALPAETCIRWRVVEVPGVRFSQREGKERWIR